MRRNDYEQIIEGVRQLFPHATDVRIEVDTNQYDIEHFSKVIHEHSDSHFVVNMGEIPEDRIYSRFRTPFGMISLNNNDGKNN